MPANARSPMTPEQERLSTELSDFVGNFFLRHNVSYEDGVRMLSTMVTWLAIQDGMSAGDFGHFMKTMHEVMLEAAMTNRAKRMASQDRGKA